MNLFVRQNLEIIASFPAFLNIYPSVCVHNNTQKQTVKGWPSLVTRRMGAGQEVDMVEGVGIGPNIK